jgi:hypothetical protein
MYALSIGVEPVEKGACYRGESIWVGRKVYYAE